MRTRTSCSKPGGPPIGNVMYVVRTGLAAHYVCHVGRSYSPQSSIAIRDDSVEEAVWTAVSALREKMMIIEELVEQSPRRGRDTRPADRGCRPPRLASPAGTHADPRKPPVPPRYPAGPAVRSPAGRHRRLCCRPPSRGALTRCSLIQGPAALLSFGAVPHILAHGVTVCRSTRHSEARTPPGAPVAVPPCSAPFRPVHDICWIGTGARPPGENAVLPCRGAGTS